MTAILIGFIAGYLSGHFGLGGGLITTPAIRLVLGYPAFIAVGTPLVANIPTALSGAYAYNRKGFVDRNIIAFLAVPGLFGSIIGAYLTRFVSGHLILLITAVVIFILGLQFPFERRRKMEREIGKLGMLAAGGAIGVFSGFLGLGGGFVLIPFLTAILGKDIKTAFGTSLAVISAITIPGAIVHYFLGHVDLLLALKLIIGVIPGALLGARVAINLPDRVLRVSFALLLMGLAVYLGYSEFAGLVS